MENNLLLLKPNSNNIMIITNYESKQFSIASYSHSLIENLFFAEVIKEKTIYTDIEIVEDEKKLYFYTANQKKTRIDINNNELLLYSIQEHPQYEQLIKRINTILESFKSE